MQKVLDAMLGEILGAPTRRLVLSLVGPSLMDWLAELERLPASIRITIWAVWILLVYIAATFAHSRWANNADRKRAALSADLRGFMNQLSALANGPSPQNREQEHAELRERIYQRVLLYDESMAHEFMGVQERQNYPTCLQDEIGKLVSFQITSRPRL
jgi:hypothetical protein